MRLADRVTPRATFLFIAIACAALLADAIFYMQGVLGLEPCPMCILQRYAFGALGLVSLAAALHDPRGGGQRAYGLLAFACALAGAAIAARHSWTQRFPPKQDTCVASDLEFLVNNFPLAQAWPKIFSGGGSCAAIDWTFLGLTLPEWGFICFVGLGLLALWAGFRRRR